MASNNRNVFFHSSEVQKSEINVCAKAVHSLKVLSKNLFLASSSFWWIQVSMVCGHITL